MIPIPSNGTLTAPLAPPSGSHWSRPDPWVVFGVFRLKLNPSCSLRAEQLLFLKTQTETKLSTPPPGFPVTISLWDPLHYSREEVREGGGVDLGQRSCPAPSSSSSSSGLGGFSWEILWRSTSRATEQLNPLRFDLNSKPLHINTARLSGTVDQDLPLKLKY